MSLNTVSLKEVKEAVGIVQVVEHYELLAGLSPKKDGYRGPCPFHKSGASRSFHISTSKNVYYCFGCKRGGNILDFVAETEDVSLPEAAKLIAGWFKVGIACPPQDSPSATPSEEPDEEDQASPINEPLSFAGLKNLNPAHASLSERGITAETASHFEGGFCQKGLMKNRVAIPIHNSTGQLIGYAGLDPESSTYKHPTNLYPWQEVYNLHRQEPGSRLVVVSDYLDVWRLHVVGVENVVAILDGRLSRHQEQRLEAFKPDRLLLLQTGHRELRGVADRLLDRFFVRHHLVPSGTDLSTLATLLA